MCAAGYLQKVFIATADKHKTHDKHLFFASTNE